MIQGRIRFIMRWGGLVLGLGLIAASTKGKPVRPRCHACKIVVESVP